MAITVNKARIIAQQRNIEPEPQQAEVRKAPTTQYRTATGRETLGEQAVVVINGKPKKLNKTSEYLLDMMSQE